MATFTDRQYMYLRECQKSDDHDVGYVQLQVVLVCVYGMTVYIWHRWYVHNDTGALQIWYFVETY
jgi:hypothetical protein